MQFKQGVSPHGLSAKGWYGAHIADQLHKEFTGREVVVTSTTEAKHRVKRSAHYRGDAVDLRCWVIAEERRHQYANELGRRLGPDYVAIYEENATHPHFHCHWSPVYREEPQTHTA